jgi:hypothetical protein
MDILFETNYTRNKEWCKEIISYCYFKRKSRIILLIIICNAIIWSAIGVFADKQYEFCGTLILYALFLLLYVISYFRAFNLTLKRDLEQSSGEIKVNTVITDSYIENIASTGSVTKLHYYDIKSVASTKNYLLLISNTKMIYSFRKDSFTKGNYTEFITFLRYKGIKI